MSALGAVFATNSIALIVQMIAWLLDGQSCSDWIKRLSNSLTTDKGEFASGQGVSQFLWWSGLEENGGSDE